MRGLGALAIMLLVGFWTELASAGTFQAFGPENITRSTGKPVAVTKNFTVLNPNTSYTIRINNGGISGEFAKVSSAVITLNGAQIVSPNEFSQTVTVIEKPITLSTSNALAIELRSKPGSGITIQVIGIDNDPPVITAAVNPAANTAGWHNADVTVSFDCTDATSGIASCSAPVTVTTEGANQVISGTAIDRAGNSAVASVVVNSDKTSPVVSIAQPADGTRFNTTPVTVTGTVTETLSGISTVTCSGIPAVLSGSNFSCEVPLTDGSNAIVVQAVDLAGNTGGSTVTVLFSRGPAVRITAPETLALFNSSPITVTGTVANSTASVVVNGVSASVSGASFSATVALREGNNTLTAVATNTFGQVDTASIQVTLDTTPPRVTIDSPADGFVTTSPSVTVSGMINDIVVGTVNGGQAQVTVNGIAAQVANRSFLVADVPLSPGPNTLTAIGVDRAGNVASTHIIVTFQPIVARPQIQLISGNNQRAPIGSPLPEPLIVALTDATGNPVPGKTVIFKVVENNGTLTNGLNTARSLALTTDAQGRAQVRWTLGTRAGAGNNRVEATAVGFASSAFFTAVATPSAAAKINIDAGSNQTGVVGEPLPRPLVAVVTDSGHNRLANVPVTFTVLQGGGSFNGQPALTLNTDSDGRALAVLTLGLQEGIENHVVEATFPGNPGFSASFVASGKVAGDPAQTRISGVVLDNTDRPIPGVTLRIEGTALVTQANDQGQFLLQPAPVGHIQLIADGSTAARPGTWPTLEYDLVTISGQNNTIGMPIYLLPLDLPNGLFVDETTGGRLTLPQVPGFSLSVAPGSATFPDGSRSGVVSVTVVHADKIPMTPNFGQQPRFIVTIQPAGVHFDPPAAITIPNVDGLAPGEVTELYSFDHDLGQFVAIGTGTVSDDSTLVRSDLGVGIIKGGWHCGGNPVQTGSCCDCGECKRCENNNCVPLVADITITAPPDNPMPSDANVATNFSFLARRAFAAIATGDPINAQATLNPAEDASQITWGVVATIGGVKDETPTDSKGPSFSFVPDPPAHPPYAPGVDGCVTGTRGNGTCGRSAPFSYAVTANFCSASDTNTITQDQIDIIRQEFINHGLTSPDRDQINEPVATTNFTVAQINNTAYTFVVGTPGDLAQAVRNAYNSLLRDDVQIASLGLTGLNPADVIVISGANIQTIGPLLDTPACNGAPNPVTCDDEVVGNTIVAGPNGIAETRALNEVSDFPLVINSAWRNPQRNEAVGGQQDSKHQSGGAVDLDVCAGSGRCTVSPEPTKTVAQLYCILQTAADSVLNTNGFAEQLSTQRDCNDARVTHVHVQTPP